MWSYDINVYTQKYNCINCQEVKYSCQQEYNTLI